MNPACPVCQREVYSRRFKACGYCGAELPAEAQFSKAEAEQVTKAFVEMEARRKREQEAEEKKKDRESRGRGIYGPGVY